MSLFIDEIELELHAGHGGHGSAAFRREKFSPRGGPYGGDGGNGGSVILRATDNLTTLSHFRRKRILKAKNGVQGLSKNQHGANAEDLIVEVPAGTLVWDVDAQTLLGDLVESGQELVVAAGGKGGRGNSRFATATNRAPTYSEPGLPGEERRVRLELKLLADIGLLGYPSVGKSTLVRAISNAKPKVAAYPFTTLTPNLGVVRWKDWVDFVVADIPGIIEGASEGKGLGQQFLRRLDRTSWLAHLIEVTPEIDGCESGRDPVGDFERLCHELAAFAPELAARPQIVVLNKIDLPFVSAREAELRAYFEARGYAFFAVSAASGAGIDALVDAFGSRVVKARRAAQSE